jgi:glycosyltransferase involved in cell wall biosynthesis
VQAISTFLGKWARVRGFTGPLEIIPNGVDTAKFAGKKIPHDGVVLITASRLVHKNAIDDIIHALVFLPDTRLEILGTGAEETALKKLAVELGVAERVAFKGFVPNQELPVHLHAADIFVRPSRSEGMGNSFIEAFAAGLPVIATQEGGIADFLFDAKRNSDQEPTGWAVDADNPGQIAAAVKEIVGNPVEAAKVIANARKLALERYDWDLIAERMKTEVFEKCLYNDRIH